MRAHGPRARVPLPLFVGFVACVLVFAAMPPVHASVIVTTSGAAGMATFFDGITPSFNPPFGLGLFETLVGQKSFTSVGALQHGVTVPDPADAHFSDANGTGLRWVETVTNDTGVGWYGFSFSSSPGVEFYPASVVNVPTFVTLTGSGAGVTNVALDGPVLVNGWTISQDIANSLITIDFSSAPLQDGESFSVYFAIVDVPFGTEFSLTQTPAVPEPGTLLLLGGGISALLLRRRRKV